MKEEVNMTVSEVWLTHINQPAQKDTTNVRRLSGCWNHG